MGDLKVGDGVGVDVVRSEGTVELAVRGEIDIVSIEGFRQALRDAVLEGPRVVNLDLSDVRFVGSEGISTLIEVRKLADRNQVKFRIVKASKRVGSVLELLGLAGYFD
jgi:anti-sigma B factor antagonist